jgi:hypothetical protein
VDSKVIYLAIRPKTDGEHRAAGIAFVIGALTAFLRFG